MKLSERLAQADAEKRGDAKPLVPPTPRSAASAGPTARSAAVASSDAAPSGAAPPMQQPTSSGARSGARSRSAAAATAAAAPANELPTVNRIARTAHRRRKGDLIDPGEGLEGQDALKARVRAAVVATLAPQLAGGTVDEVRIRKEMEAQLDAALTKSTVSLPPSDRSAFLDSTIEDMLGWGALTPLMADPTITEIMCNSATEVFVERGGRIGRTNVHFPTQAAYRLVIDRMLATAGRRVDESSPMADGRLSDGSRVNAIIPPLSVHGAVLTIRRFPERAFTVTDLIAKESVSADAAVFLEAAVRGKLNMVVSGGTGTGKTTLLNVLASFVPPDERLITIEDAAELRLGQPHVVTLESRPPNIEGAGAISIRDLVRNALRMRPDRIVVGEVRDAAALDMLQAMNTGHEGSLTTIHANSPRDALARIETMVLFSGIDLPLRAIREQVASALDVIVQLERRPDGSRVVSMITEVQGREGDTITLQDIYARRGGGALLATGLRPAVVERLADQGVTLPPTHFRTKVRPVTPSLGRTRRVR